MVKAPAAHLPTIGGPTTVQTASPTCMADSRKNHAHLHGTTIPTYSQEIAFMSATHDLPEFPMVSGSEVAL